MVQRHLLQPVFAGLCTRQQGVFALPHTALMELFQFDLASLLGREGVTALAQLARGYESEAAGHCQAHDGHQQQTCVHI